MVQQSVYYVGSDDEVAHHARPIVDACRVRIVSAEEVLTHAKPGDLAIFFSEHFRRFREAVPILQQRNVATLYAIDGILEWRNAWENRPDEPASPLTMRPVLSHKVATIGPSQTRVLNAWGNQGRTETVGLPRLDALQNRSSQNQPSRASDQTFRVLIVSAKWPGFTPEQMECARQAFRDVRQWFEKHPIIAGRRVETKWRLTQGLADDVGVENALRDMTGQDMASALRESDALITTPSTAMLEGMLHRLPVALLDYNACPHYVSAAWEIFAPRHLDRILPELATPPAPKLAWQQTLLHDALACQTPAAPRLEALVQRMLAIANESVQAGRELNFPANLLEDSGALHGCRTESFEHAAMYPDIPEFQTSDLEQTQIALVDARRVIEQLDSEVAQLKKELGQAHEIFDQIHRHPIAGPIVRARQRLLDWFAARGTAKLDRTPEPSIRSKSGRTT